MKKLVSGHRNPDTDSIVSAIALSRYLKKSGIMATPVFIGKMNRETEFILKYFKEKVPQSIQKAMAGAKFYLVDHGGLEQSVPGLKEENILGVIDHHQMGGLKTLEPILYRCEVLGSTSTLIAKMFDERGWSLDKKTASILCSGIISDTLNLTSKTTTPEDKKMIKKLSGIGGIDTGKFSQKMFEAKSDITGINLKKILSGDYKEYNQNGKKVGIGVFETVAVRPFSEKNDRIFELLKKIKKEKGTDFFFFGLVDILKKNTFFYLIGDEEIGVAEKAFNLSGKKSGEVVILKGVTSRKKQIVPFLLKYI